MIKCEACEHEDILSSIVYTGDDDFWLDVVNDRIGHICDDYKCPHTCGIEEYVEDTTEDIEWDS